MCVPRPQLILCLYLREFDRLCACVFLFPDLYRAYICTTLIGSVHVCIDFNSSTAIDHVLMPAQA